jgi:hypothetical protein
VLDGLLVAGSIWLLPLLRLQFAAPSFAGAWLVLAAYFGMCAGMWLLKLVEQAPKPQPAKAVSDDASGCLGFLSFAFSVFVLTMLLIVLGVGEQGPTAQAVDRWTAAHPAMVGLFSVLAVTALCLFPAAAVSKVRPLIAAGSGRALAARIVGVLGANTMILVTAAWWQAYLGGSEPSGLSTGGRVLLGACFYVLFLMFYAPPRLVLLAMEDDKLSLITFLAVLTWIVWPLTA